MGTMSNPEFFLSEKDLNTNNSMECNSFSSSRHQQEIKKEEDQCRELLVSRTLEIKLPSLGEEFKNDDEDHHQDGYTTPRSMDHKLPLIFACPPAPRKPKSIPRKRKAGSACRRSILITDLSTEIEALFSPAVLHGLADLGGIIKKVKNI